MKRICIPASKSKTQYFINQAYVEYVSDAGLIPVIVTPETTKVAGEMCDGLLLPGGIDLDPIYYGEDNIASYQTDPDKDAFERELLYDFMDMGKPIFGICRGFQLIVREFLMSITVKGFHEHFTFYQNVGSHNQTGSLSVDRPLASHFVTASVSELYNKPGKSIKEIPINSMHHQCLAFEKGVKPTPEMKKHLSILAWTDRGFDKKDKLVVIEAVRIKTWASPILAVQWHPEEMKDTALLKGFFLGKKRNQDDKKVKSAVEG